MTIWILFQHIYTDWNEKADGLSHEARDKGSSWTSSMHEGEKLEEVRAFFDRGVSNHDHRVKYKVGSGYVIQTSERIEEDVEKMCWKQVSKWQRPFLTMPR